MVYAAVGTSVAFAHLESQMPGNGEDILVTPPAHVHADDMILGQIRCDLGDMRQGVTGLQRGDNPFAFAAQLERLQRLLVSDGHVLRTAYVMQPAVLGTDTGVIETGGNRVSLEDLAVIILQEIGAIAVQNAGPATGERGAMLHLGVHALATGLDPDDVD